MIAVSARDVFIVHSTAEGEAAALQGLSLDVPTGELLVILGPSGSGKTSLLQAIAGQLRPSSGQLHVFGDDVAKMTDRQRAAYRAGTLGYLDQHYWRVLSPELDVSDVVSLQLALRGWSRDVCRKRAGELLTAVDLDEKADQNVGALSGGEQQRVALCAALAHKPRVLLADEATGELDAHSAAMVHRLTRDLVKTMGCTAVVVTHDHRWEAVADRVVRIRDGRVTEELRASGDGREALVVDERGWVRIPEAARVRSGITSRVRVEYGDGRIVLRPLLDGAPVTPQDAEQPADPDVPEAARVRGEPAASVCGVRKAYGSAPVLSGVDADFHAGTFHVVTGPSGCGKTTLLRLIAGLERFDEGEIVVAGRSLRSLDEGARSELRRTEIAYLSQQSMLIEQLTAAENVELGLSVRGLDDPGLVAPALAQVGLTARADHRLRRLSAGERARVALARALATGSRIVVLDEPTSRLDETNVMLVAALLARIASDRNIAVICATHDPAVIAFADANLSLAVAE